MVNNPTSYNATLLYTVSCRYPHHSSMIIENIAVYSKTSTSGPSEKRTTSLQRTSFVPPIDIPTELVLKKPLRGGHLPTPNNGHWPRPLLTSANTSDLQERTEKPHPPNISYYNYLIFFYIALVNNGTTLVLLFNTIYMRISNATS